MGASLYCTGPVHHFIQTYGGGDGSQNPTLSVPYYLGTAERTPQPRFLSSYEAAFSEAKGRNLPAEWLMAGQHAITSSTLTRWDENTYSLIANKGSQSRGKIAKKDIGALVLRQGLTFVLTLLFPYSNFFPGMPKAVRWPQTILEDEVFDTVGTQARKLGLVFHSIYDTTTDGFLLYDDNAETAFLLALTR